MKPAWRGRSQSIPLLALNILILACVVFLFVSYVTGYQRRLQEENLINIANLNQSAANTATAMLKSWEDKLADVALYLNDNSLTCDEALDYILTTNSDPNRAFELIGGDYTGYLARRDKNGEWIKVSYKHSSYKELHDIFDDAGISDGGARFVPEFTDSYLAVKFFAVSTYVPIENEAGEIVYHTLMIGSKASNVVEYFNSQGVFDGMSSVLFDARGGQYIISSSTDFRSDNFYRYLKEYNDLTLDQRNDIEHAVRESDSGVLYYKNGLGKDCVFRYVKMEGNDWYCVTSVPVSSFRPLVLNSSYIVYSMVMLLLLFAADVFYLRRLNQRLRISVQREIEAGNAKMEFLSRMSHDIRTPLNGIIGMTMLASDENNTPNTAKYLDYIRVSGDFLMGLVNDVLDMSKVESGMLELNPEPYTSDEFKMYIDAVITPLCREKRHEFRINAPSSSDPLMFDRLRLNQIFFNLLSNAVKYTPEGGLIELSWESKRLPNNRAAVDFVVRDNGIGMSPEYQEHMFESFSQEKRDPGTLGTGLGLSIVKSLIDIMGGEISVTSAEGKGTTFNVHLEADRCANDAVKAPDAAKTSLAGCLVLICEDNNINAIISKGILEKYGANVEIAENGRVGLDAFANSAPGKYDAILMDVQMPVMDGLEATRAMRALDKADAKTIPIVAMTANAYDTDVMNCLSAGMNAHTGKPIQPDMLCGLLAKMISENRKQRV